MKKQKPGLKGFKEAVKNTPPDRLARIEYRSHFFQALGISFVCVLLVLKGYWYIIFAFIFGLGISYSQGMTAYKKWRNIKLFLGEEDPKEFETDISPTRRRSKIITHVYGKWANRIAIVISVVLSYVIIGFPGWLKSLAYLILIPIFYSLLYFFAIYWIAYPIYKKEIKNK